MKTHTLDFLSHKYGLNISVFLQIIPALKTDVYCHIPNMPGCFNVSTVCNYLLYKGIFITVTSCANAPAGPGFAPMVSEYVEFDRQTLASLVNDKPRLVRGICGEVLVQWQEREQLQSLEEQKQLGVVGIYPDRKEAFVNFRDFWDGEKEEIAMVTSTLEGFRKFVGDPGHELIEHKIQSGCEIQILFTHPDYLNFRAANENVCEESIRHQLFETLSQLEPLLQSGKSGRKSGGVLEARWFKNPPTCFAVMTQSYMILNPYPYMRTAYASFAMIVRKTTRRDDIFHVFREFHFQRAWDRAEPVKVEKEA